MFATVDVKNTLVERTCCSIYSETATAGEAANRSKRHHETVHETKKKKNVRHKSAAPQLLHAIVDKMPHSPMQANERWSVVPPRAGLHHYDSAWTLDDGDDGGAGSWTLVAGAGGSTLQVQLSGLIEGRRESGWGWGG